MKAIIFKGVNRLALEERPEPAITHADDVVVRIDSTGICGTDRNIYLGNFKAREGVILGHESVGVVAAVGPAVRNFKAGDRVIVNPTLNCGRCDFCQRGELNFCDNKAGSEIGVDRDGTFASHSVFPEQFLYKLPKGMEFSRAVVVEPLACVLNNAKAANLRAEDDVAIIGAGPIGMVWGLYAQRVALRTTMLENNPFRIQFARKHLERVIDSGADNAVAAAIAANGGRKFRVVVDTTGVMLERSLELVSKGGCVVLMGFNAGYKATIHPLTLVGNGIRIIGAGDYNSQIFPAAIDLAATLPLESLVTHQIGLDEYEKAFGLIAGGSNNAAYGAMKVVIRS
ncbi:alcohol dehydrogenase catalytic domain-containing protein [Archangium violaceum]|uniref:zinc-dependent alcohol dehydrogenase n=1 Tax=Archangium violaceum TaxID=83451 RepID=UPI00195236E9|nr:alcohol dehydrogenase catalytic domain-containing protein [Archangium violaceum]QRN97700.1 alcohol dehydrogenase catalytic domain-containing protein [Archangium violaceum]